MHLLEEDKISLAPRARYISLDLRPEETRKTAHVKTENAQALHPSAAASIGWTSSPVLLPAYRELDPGLSDKQIAVPGRAPRRRTSVDPDPSTLFGGS